MKQIWSPWRMDYIEKPKQEGICVFCDALAAEDGPDNLIVHRGRRAFVILNRYPYTSGHLMIVPFDHHPALEDLDHETRAELMDLASVATRTLTNTYRPEGFNLGINIGEAAGAGILDHIHIHIVPRWVGDTSFMSALGGVRVLPQSLEDTYHRIKNAWPNAIA
ncbi:MAG TPA: HIT domain-containing protein [Anaerolineales bacterium]|nr:HIT domain-containing protein [Anaerolineales bacterium]